MRDKILNGYIKDFKHDYGFQDLSESALFETFANFCAFSQHHPDTLELDTVSLGGGGDWGIDGLGILVNDHIVNSIEEIEYFKGKLNRFDVKFVFVQSKRSPKFDLGGISKFLVGVRRFFEADSTNTANESISHSRRLTDYIYDSSIDMDAPPTCHLYYITSGEWKEPELLQDRFDTGRQDLESTNLFSGVAITPVGGERLKKYYRSIKHKVVRELHFDKHTIFPQIGGVSEAYIGLVAAQDYVDLICNDEGKLHRRLFNSNVRDFQGHNSVNKEIAETVQDSERKDRFALLNNGITIVSRDVNKVGAKFRLKDFQIVNGCQTSHILYRNKEHLSEDVHVPVKIVVTTESEVINQVIKGTNRQTEVHLEAFESLQPFQKKLEQFFNAVSRDLEEKVYYERRSGQYEHLSISRNQVISLGLLTKCFVAVFLNEPHSTHRYYGELLDSYRNRMFLDNHSPWPYFTSAQLYRSLQGSNIPDIVRTLRMQAMMVIRMRFSEIELPYLNSHKMEKYCKPLLEVYNDEDKRAEAISKTSRILHEALEETGLDKNKAKRTKEFSKVLEEKATHEDSEGPAQASRRTGKIKWFSDVKGYGFIETDTEDVFLHISKIENEEAANISEGMRVKFTTVETEKGPQAWSVRLLT